MRKATQERVRQNLPRQNFCAVDPSLTLPSLPFVRCDGRTALSSYLVIAVGTGCIPFFKVGRKGGRGLIEKPHLHFGDPGTKWNQTQVNDFKTT